MVVLPEEYRVAVGPCVPDTGAASHSLQPRFNRVAMSVPLPKNSTIEQERRKTEDNGMSSVFLL